MGRLDLPDKSRDEDGASPPSDPNSETRGAIERLLPKAVAELSDVVENGGTRKLRIRCDTCGATNSHDLRVADADLLVKAVSALSSALPRMQSKDDGRSERATRILTDYAELTSAELAQYIVDLEAQIGQDNDPH